MINNWLEVATWRGEQLTDAFEALTLNAGLPCQENILPPKPIEPSLPASQQWIVAAGSALNLGVEPISVSGSEIEAFVKRGSPSLLLFAPNQALAGSLARVLVLAKREGRHVLVAAPDGTLHRFDANWLVEAVVAHVFPPDTEIGMIFEDQPGLARRLVETLQAEKRESNLVGSGVLLTLPPTRRLLSLARKDGAYRDAVAIAVAVTVRFVCAFLAWASLSAVALQGFVDSGRVVAWGILLIATVPIDLIVVRSAGRLSLTLGVVLRRRVLEGTFRVSTDRIREQGIGPSVALANEPEVLEEALVPQVISGLGAGLNLFAALVLLATGPAALLQLGMFVLLFGVGVWRSVTLWRATVSVGETRCSLTGELVDRLVGHRTRMVQQPRERWHEGEDEPLSGYAEEVRRLNDLTAFLQVLPRLWLTLGSATIFAMLIRDPTNVVSISGLVGVVLGQQVFANFTSLVPNVLSSLTSYRRLKPLIEAGSYEPSKAPPAPADPTAYDKVGPVVQAIDLDFEHHVGGRKVFEHAGLTINTGDRILLEGVSGSGKSTFAAVLAGLRTPTSGVLLVGGHERHTLGASDWRRIVASAPQFHENHIFSNTVAFNVLAGRAWPPDPADLVEAEEVCRELGLGPLLDRMPARLQQLVGPVGWQLSHGEQSRLFVARALLQRASLIILDESFGALDPETLRVSVDCVRRRAPSLLVIAHR